MKVVFVGRLGNDEPVGYGGVGLHPSYNGVGRDSSHRLSHIVGRPHRVPIKQARYQDQILPLANKIAGIYQQVVAVPVDHDDPTAEIIQDFSVGFKTMKTNKMAMVA